MTALHVSGGVSPPNGSTTKTINFTTDGSAPFTPTNGSLLVFLIFGGVTNTNGTWTEQLQPVNGGELSVFTITASSTTSITITNNGSNYAEGWEVYEYPSGSTYVSGVASNSVTLTANCPTLSSLTGTNDLFAAKGVTHPSNPSGTISSTWTAPYVKGAERWSPFGASGSSTDGAFLTVARSVASTATSMSPACTVTTGGGGFATDAQAVTFAIHDSGGAGTTPFTRDYASTWRVINALTRDYASTWRVTNALTTDYGSTWRVLNSLTRDYASTWRVLNALTADYISTWRVFNALTRDYASTWRVLNTFAARDFSSTWRVLNGLTVDYSSTWRVFNTLARDYASTWDVLSGTAFVRDFGSTWRVFNGLSADYSSTYRVLGTFARDYASVWRSLAGFTRDYGSSWRVYRAFTRDYTSTWAVIAITPSGLVVQVWSGTTLVAATLTIWNGTTEIAATVESIVP